jgi:uncharacterized protein (TIRG00374 family)
VLSLGVVALAIFERERIGEAFVSLQTARFDLLGVALLLSLFSFFLTSLLYHIALRSLGYRQIGLLRVYGITIVALILSQAVPAGGVASYAFLAQAVRRRGVPAGHAALLASLEAITYVVAVLILFGFGITYLAVQSGNGAGNSEWLAAIAPIVLVGGAIFLITRRRATLNRWLLAAKNGLARLFRRQWSDAPVLKLVDEIARGRELIAERPTVLATMLGVELLSLLGHSLVMLLVLYSLGASPSLLVVTAAFGIVMVTSTFNALPGGGGTVETVLAVTLQGLGVGTQAIAAAVIFRLINFWIMIPVAALCYWLLSREVAADPPGQPEPVVSTATTAVPLPNINHHASEEAETAHPTDPVVR